MLCNWLLGRSAGRETCKGLSQEGRDKWRREKILLGLKEEEGGSLGVYSLSSNIIGLFPCHISMSKYSHKSLQTFHRGRWSLSASEWWEISKPHLITRTCSFQFLVNKDVFLVSQVLNLLFQECLCSCPVTLVQSSGQASLYYSLIVAWTSPSWNLYKWSFF